MTINGKLRFAASKCDRCGKATKAMQNGIGDLYRLPEAFGAPLCDEGDFCAACCERYDRENWIDWMRQRRPHIFTRKERVTDD